MKLYESTQSYMKKQGSRSTSYKHPDIKESADFIIQGVSKKERHFKYICKVANN